jgi:hypothetical protein
VEQFGAGSGAERVQTRPQLVLKLIRTHVNRRRTASPDVRGSSGGMPVDAVIHPAACPFQRPRSPIRSLDLLAAWLGGVVEGRPPRCWRQARFATSRWLRRSGEATTIFVGFVNRLQLIPLASSASALHRRLFWPMVTSRSRIPG